MPFASREYIAQLTARRATVAQTAERITREALHCNLTGADMADVIRSTAPLRREAAALDQQIAWLQRDTGWCHPAEPAWTD